MLYGTDYKSGAQDDDARVLRRFRRDVMFLFARPQEVAAAGAVAGMAVLPVVLVVGIAAAIVFWMVIGGAPHLEIVPPSGGTGADVAARASTATSWRDALLVLLASFVVLGLAGAISAVVRRVDYKRQGGLRYYLDRPRSFRALLSFFAPVGALAIVLMAKEGIFEERQRDLDMVSASLLDRGVVYLFIALTLSMLLYLVWETLFPLILPTLSNLDVNGEVARLQREDAARVTAEEDHVRGLRPG